MPPSLISTTPLHVFATTVPAFACLARAQLHSSRDPVGANRPGSATCARYSGMLSAPASIAAIALPTPKHHGMPCPQKPCVRSNSSHLGQGGGDATAVASATGNGSWDREHSARTAATYTPDRTGPTSGLPSAVKPSTPVHSASTSTAGSDGKASRRKRRRYAPTGALRVASSRLPTCVRARRKTRRKRRLGEQTAVRTLHRHRAA